MIDWFFWIGASFAIALVAVGFLGTFFPIIPATPLIFAGALLYAWVDNFEHVTGKTLLALALIAAVAWGIQQVSGILGAKKFGSSGWGIFGATVGSIVALFAGGILGPFGFVIFPFLFAFLFELAFKKRTAKSSLRSGMGSAIGVLGGVVMQIVAGIIMVIVFVRAVL